MKFDAQGRLVSRSGQPGDLDDAVRAGRAMTTRKRSR